ncbi:MAG: hypothetical protein U5J96_14420 [Ignavibacteriaceae bacterium]|nr:hypothetical protein [Ignavibacteriaceae bacterium]
MKITYVAQYGSDNGIERSIQLTKSYLTNLPFNNGSRYYFAVTSYAIFNNSGLPDSVQVPNNLENTFIVLTVVPQVLILCIDVFQLLMEIQSRSLMHEWTTGLMELVVPSRLLIRVKVNMDDTYEVTLRYRAVAEGDNCVEL